MHPAIENLRDCQRQLDMDGCEVAVSRQALDETLEVLADLLSASKRLTIQMNNLLMVAEVPARFAADFNDGQRQAEAAIAKAESRPSTFTNAILAGSR